MDSFFVAIVVVLCSFLGGALTHWVFRWGHARDIAELQYRVEDLEGRVLRETRIRAADKSVSARNSNQRLDEWAAEQIEGSNPSKKSSVGSFMDWRWNKMKGG